MMRMTSETKESEYQVRLNDLKKELDKSKVVNLKMELKISDLREKVKMKGNEGQWFIVFFLITCLQVYYYWKD